MENKEIELKESLPAMNQESQIKLIKSRIAPTSTDDEFKLLLYMAKKYDLDPLVGQIWLVKFGNSKAQIYASRDGFLEIAHRSGKFNGMETTVRQEKGEFVATCIVYHKDMEHPIKIEVWESEYSTKKNLWLTKRRTMISKVAESQCLRKCFSISGLYDQAEIHEPILNEKEVSHETKTEKLKDPVKILKWIEEKENKFYHMTKILFEQYPMYGVPELFELSKNVNNDPEKAKSVMELSLDSKMSIPEALKIIKEKTK